MSGCAHMNPAEWCASCIPEKYDALREENARLRAEVVGSEERAKLLLDAKNHWADRARAAEAEVKRLEGLILEAEADIKAMGIEAHPAVLMRLDRLIRRIRGEKP